MTPFYRVCCDKCGHAERTDSDDRFMDPFFLPARCPQCSDLKSRSARYGEQSGWTVSFGYFERTVAFRWLQPSTWYAPERWIEWSGDVTKGAGHGE